MASIGCNHGVPISAPARVAVKHSFDSVKEYEEIFRAGTEFETNFTKSDIDKFNEDRKVFRSWCVRKMSQDSEEQHWVVVVDPGQSPSKMFPKQGDKFTLTIYDSMGEQALSRDWRASRIEGKDPSLAKFATFKLSMPVRMPVTLVMKPVLDEKSSPDETPVLTATNQMYVMLYLESSDPTSCVELEALDNLVKGAESDKMTRSQAAFNWIRNFKDSAQSVDLFKEIPHMAYAIDSQDLLPPALRERVNRMNPMQKAAYESLKDLPCGICITPGGPGGGKTFFNLLVSSIAQSQPIEYEEDGIKKSRAVKVLYLLDINSPVNDATNKCVKMSEELGDDKAIVRMFGWSREFASWRTKARNTQAAATVTEEEDDGDEDAMKPTVPFVVSNRPLTPDALDEDSNKITCRAPTLEEAALKHLKSNESMYPELARLTKEYMANPSIFKEMPALREETFKLYKDTLEEVDFVASTPVAASCLAGGKYKPDLVFLDESAHARELTNLIPISLFPDASAWFFTGDFRQTGCFLASRDKNPWSPQLSISIMERAYHTGAIKHGLLMNHRAFGDLHRLPSGLFYGGTMVSGLSPEDKNPQAMKSVRSYFEKNVTGGRQVSVPRLMAHAYGCKLPTKIGTSWWNVSHQSWIMGQVGKLAKDANFTGLDGKSPGSILIITFYKESFLRYKAAIRTLQAENAALGGRRLVVEARTVDTVQGHEADIVFIDLVRERVTSFLDNEKRLAVAMTRGRLGEVYVMQPSMVRTLGETTYLKKIYDSCREGREGRTTWVRL